MADVRQDPRIARIFRKSVPDAPQQAGLFEDAQEKVCIPDDHVRLGRGDGRRAARDAPVVRRDGGEGIRAGVAGDEAARLGEEHP